jgi:TRAP-type C4-dicarboxylate transport system substrate-binding protein
VTSHHLNLPLGAVAVGVVMRKDKFDALPEQAKAAFEQFSGEALSRKIGQALDDQHEEVLAKVSKSRRNEVVTPDEATTQAWRTALQPVVEGWRGLKPDNEKLYTSFTGEIEKIRAGN